MVTSPVDTPSTTARFIRSRLTYYVTQYRPLATPDMLKLVPPDLAQAITDFLAALDRWNHAG